MTQSRLSIPAFVGVILVVAALIFYACLKFEIVSSKAAAEFMNKYADFVFVVNGELQDVTANNKASESFSSDMVVSTLSDGQMNSPSKDNSFKGVFKSTFDLDAAERELASQTIEKEKNRQEKESGLANKSPVSESEKILERDQSRIAAAVFVGETINTTEKGWWIEYSKKIPPLYSAPLNNTTSINLNKVGQISEVLDQLREGNLSAWKTRFDLDIDTLIYIAVDGEREGARAVSFQYADAPLSNTVESLAWAMIANAIHENEYYVYICLSRFSLCTESVFAQASGKAEDYIRHYRFQLKKSAYTL